MRVPRFAARPSAAALAAIIAIVLMPGAEPGALCASRSQTEPPATPPAAPPATGSPAAGTAPADGAPPAAAAHPAGEDPGRTAGSVLAWFMASRDYHTIRELKSVMTPTLTAAYDHDATPFSGKKGFRLSAFDYREPAPKPSSTAYTASVRCLWDDQGEAVELRTESVRLTRDHDASWRVAGLEKTASEPLRYQKSIAGVTSLRMLLRDWIRRDVDGARGILTDACAKRLDGTSDGLVTIFVGDPGLRRAAYRILELTPDGTSKVRAKVRLFETPPGRPASLDGLAREITLVKKGQRWLVDDWK
ncbi:MAG TPA: hypothetical protein VFB49_01780 [Patescibacteria group bacterium]|nr:hypothetical protein [Patescibacteria group bacterium]